MGKHRIRKTGEIVEVVSFNGTTRRDKTDSVSYIDSKGVEHENEPLNYYWDLEHISDSKGDIDWEQRRYEIAKAALQGHLSNQYGDVIIGQMGYKGAALSSVAFADALIEELKKEKNQ